MTPASNPLVNHFHWPDIIYLLSELSTLTIAGLLMLTGSAVMALSIWPDEPKPVYLLYVFSFFIIWRVVQAFQSAQMTLLFMIAIIGSIGSVLPGLDKTILIRIIIGTPIIISCVAAAVQVYRYSRSLRAVRAIRRGRPYVLYFRSSMADDGPFWGHEANLVAVLESIGPTVMLSKWRFFRKSSIVRLNWLKWQPHVSELMRHAALVVFFIMPRRGYDKGSEDLLWDEFEQDEVKTLLPTGKVVLFFREGWANRELALVNMNGTVRYGSTSLMSEVHRVMRTHVSAKWPEDLRNARFLWFSPGAKPQSLGEFHRTLGMRQRFIAELTPVFDYLGVKSKSRWFEYAFLAGVVLFGAWLASATQALILRIFEKFWLPLSIVSAVLWLAIIVIGIVSIHNYFRWQDYENFVLHKKYR